MLLYIGNCKSRKVQSSFCTQQNVFIHKCVYVEYVNIYIFIFICTAHPPIEYRKVYNTLLGYVCINCM